jgi:hypothetical protein
MQLQAMGVDLMPFSINTARARFLRLGIEFFDSKTAMNRQDAFPVPCVGSSCSCTVFPVACVGSGLQMPWLQQGSFNKYISVYPINHFDDEGSEKLVSECNASVSTMLCMCLVSKIPRVLARGSCRT